MVIPTSTGNCWPVIGPWPWTIGPIIGQLTMSSCSSDGAILNWTVLENCLVATLITVIPFTRQIKSEVGVSKKKCLLNSFCSLLIFGPVSCLPVLHYPSIGSLHLISEDD